VRRLETLATAGGWLLILLAFAYFSAHAALAILD
jgi:hypothetical protein